MGIPQTKCRYCNADIIFIKTKAGKTMPLDAESIYFKDDPKGCSFVLLDGTVIKGTTVKEGTPDAKIGFISHFATCPNANQARKPRKSERKNK